MSNIYRLNYTIEHFHLLIYNHLVIQNSIIYIFIDNKSLIYKYYHI